MARIRTIKPDYWEDETVAALSLRARLLFIATWNFADDEGLLRWTPEYITANAFMYDGLSVKQTSVVMAELVAADLVYPYKGGKTQQPLAYIPHFLRHQRINRPQPSKLPPPSLQSPEAHKMYARRDGWTCGICNEPINAVPKDDDRWNLSLDHIQPRSDGGSDYPSNIRATHQSCNKAKRERSVNGSGTNSVNGSASDAMTDAPDDSLPDSPPEGKGREGNPPTPPQSGGSEHRGQHPNCRACGTSRRGPTTTTTPSDPFARQRQALLDRAEADHDHLRDVLATPPADPDVVAAALAAARHAAEHPLAPEDT